MTQSQVMEHLAKAVGITKKNTKLALGELNVLVVRALKKEGSIRLAGFGFGSSSARREEKTSLQAESRRRQEKYYQGRQPVGVW